MKKRELHYSVKEDNDRVFYFDDGYYFQMRTQKTNIPWHLRSKYILRFNGDVENKHSCSVKEVLLFNKLLKRFGCS